MPADFGNMLASMGPILILLVVMICMTVIPNRK